MTLEAKLASETGRFADANGQLTLSCVGLAAGDGKTPLKVPSIPMLAQGITLPRIRIGDLGGHVAIEKGTAKLQGVESKSPDGEVALEGEIALHDPLSLTTLNLYLRFKLSDALMKKEVALQILPAVAAAGKRPDGSYGVKFGGRVGQMTQPVFTPMSPVASTRRAGSPAGRRAARRCRRRPFRLRRPPRRRRRRRRRRRPRPLRLRRRRRPRRPRPRDAAGTRAQPAARRRGGAAARRMERRPAPAARRRGGRRLLPTLRPPPPHRPPKTSPLSRGQERHAWRWGAFRARRLSQAEALHLVAERGPRDAEGARGAPAAAVVSAQRPPEDLALDLVERAAGDPDRVVRQREVRGRRVAAGGGMVFVLGEPERRAAGDSSSASTSMRPSPRCPLRIAARRMVFRSSRTLPGKTAVVSADSAAASSRRSPTSPAISRRKCAASSGMSPRRSRSGGRRRQKPARR